MSTETQDTPDRPERERQRRTREGSAPSGPRRPAARHGPAGRERDALLKLCVQRREGGGWRAFVGFTDIGDPVVQVYHSEREAWAAVLEAATEAGG